MRITVTQAAITYVDCGKSANTRYSTITGYDGYGYQWTNGAWRHTGTTVIYIKDKATGRTDSATVSEDNPKEGIAILFVASRPHQHYGTDHQN